MPRYFFDLHDEQSHLDYDGIDLVDVAAAKIVATSTAACLLKVDPKRFWCDHGWHLRVRGEAGAPLFEISFLMHVAPLQPTVWRSQIRAYPTRQS